MMESWACRDARSDGARLQVGHRADAGVAARCCRRGACCDGFFIKKAGFTKMYMYIGETRHDYHT